MTRAFIVAILAVLALPLGAFPSTAHPLGNFTVNHLSRVSVAADAIRVRYVLDLAEIPALQEAQGGRIAGIAQRLASDIELRIDGVAVPLALRASTVDQVPGQAGLTTLRVTMDLVGPAARDGARLEYRDGTYVGRIGWHAVVLDGGVRDGSASADDPTDELRAYPSDPTVTPPDVTSASAIVDLSTVSRGSSGPAFSAAPRLAIDVSADVLAAFLRGGASDLGALAGALVVAMLLGALHALGPGHGKAMVAAYLVGSRGTPAQAVILGVTVTVTHTLGVYALGAVTLVAAQYLLPERLYPVLGLASGLLVVGIGLGLLRVRLGALRTSTARSEDRPHHHDHGDGPGQHRHDAVGLRGLLALGISGGLLPCPSALVVLLAAVSFHNVPLGMVLVAAFSIGLATVLVSIGLAFVIAQRAIARRELRTPFAASAAARALPALSAAAITIAGVLIALGAVRGLA